MSKGAGEDHMWRIRSPNGQGFQKEDCNPLEDGDLKCWLSGLSHSALFVVVLTVPLGNLAGEAYFV